MDDVLNPGFGEALREEEMGTLASVQHVSQQEELVGTVARHQGLLSQRRNERVELHEAAFQIRHRMSVGV